MCVATRQDRRGDGNRSLARFALGRLVDALSGVELGDRAAYPDHPGVEVYILTALPHRLTPTKPAEGPQEDEHAIPGL